MLNPGLLLGEIRSLAGKCTAGKHDSPKAFGDLVSKILHLTVAKQNEIIRLNDGPTPELFILGGARGATDPIRLNNNRYLRVTVTLRRNPKSGELSITQVSYQYQLDREDNHRWIFRYDYLQNPKPESPYPPSHLQLNAKPPPDVGIHRDLHKIHFPVGRVSLEAVIRLLAQEFQVRCNNSAKIWDPVLSESERLFH